MGSIVNMTLDRESDSAKKKCQVWKKRTLVERYLIVIIFVMCFVFIVLTGLLIHLINSYRHLPIPICNSSMCKREAGRIISYMDFSADPCEDFYTFSCGSYVKNQRPPTIGGRANQEYLVQEHMRKLSKELIESADENVEPEFIKKLKMYYKSCLDRDTDTSKIIKNLLLKTNLKIWPIVKEDVYDIEKILAIVDLYGGNPFYVAFTGDNKNTGKLTIIGWGSTIADEEILLNTTEEKSVRKKEEYRKLLLYTFFKANAPFEIKNDEADKIIEFETKLAKVRQNHTDYDEGTNSTLNEFLLECEGISFVKLLNYTYEYLGHIEDFSDDIPITVHRSEYLEIICEILKTTDKRTIYNYLVWYFLAGKLKEFDPYFTKKFHDIADEDYVSIARWRECIHTMTTKMMLEPGVSYLVLKHMQPDETLEEVKDYILEIRNTMEHMFSEENWIDPNSKNLFIKRMWNISADIGYSSGYLDIELLEKHFSMVNVTEDYLENNLRLAVLRTSSRLFNDTLSFIQNITIYFPIKSSGYFTGEKFVLTVGILVPPFFINKGPKFLNYAVTGFVIAHELIHAYDCPDKYHSEENGTGIWTNETIQRFVEKKQCYVDQYSKYPLDDDGLMVNGSYTFGDNIADNGGIIQAYVAYENYLKYNGEEPHLPGLDYTNQQMFFITYAQQWCEVVKSQVKEYKSDAHSPAKYRVIGPLQNFPQFSETFKCPVDSPMNPLVKCRMYG